MFLDISVQILVFPYDFKSNNLGIVVVQLLSCVQLSATPWTATCLTPLSMEFSRQEYWSGLLFPSPGDLPN